MGPCLCSPDHASVHRTRFPIFWAWAAEGRLDLEAEGLRKSFLPCPLHLIISGLLSLPGGLPTTHTLQSRAGWAPAPTSVGRISPELQASHCRVSLHLVPGKFLLPYLMPHWLCRPRPSGLLGHALSQDQSKWCGLSDASFVPPGILAILLLSLEPSWHIGRPGAQKNLGDSRCL